MKGCLKAVIAPGMPPRTSSGSKSVAFGPDDDAIVHLADEYDRTPTEPSHNLSFNDRLELRAIRWSLPYAIQPVDDPYATTTKRRSASQDSRPSQGGSSKFDRVSVIDRRSASTNGSRATRAEEDSRDQVTVDPTTSSTSTGVSSSSSHSIPPPPHSARLPIVQPKTKPSFSFVPLLDTPSPASPSINVRNATPPPPRSSHYASTLTSSSSPPPSALGTLLNPLDPYNDDVQPDDIDAEAETDLDGDPLGSDWARRLAIKDSRAQAQAQGGSTPIPIDKDTLVDRNWQRRHTRFDCPLPDKGVNDCDERGRPFNVKEMATGQSSLILDATVRGLLRPSAPSVKKRRFILVNDIEIEIDDD